MSLSVFVIDVRTATVGGSHRAVAASHAASQFGLVPSLVMLALVVAILIMSGLLVQASPIAG